MLVLEGVQVDVAVGQGVVGGDVVGELHDLQVNAFFFQGSPVAGAHRSS